MKRGFDTWREAPLLNHHPKFPALQIPPALLYFWALSLTFTVQKGSLFVRTLGNTPSTSNRMVRDSLREQVSEGLFIAAVGIS
jgi:hypothetical protein